MATEAEFLRRLDLAAQTVESALEAMPDEVSVHTTPFVSLLNSIQGPARRAVEVLTDRHASLRECIPYVMGAEPTLPSQVHVVVLPASDGQGVRLLVFEKEDDAFEAAARCCPPSSVHSVLVEKGED